MLLTTHRMVTLLERLSVAWTLSKWVQETLLSHSCRIHAWSLLFRTCMMFQFGAWNFWRTVSSRTFIHDHGVMRWVSITVLFIYKCSDWTFRFLPTFSRTFTNRPSFSLMTMFHFWPSHNSHPPGLNSKHRRSLYSLNVVWYPLTQRKCGLGSLITLKPPL